MTMRFWTRTVAVTAAGLLALTGCATGGEEVATSSSHGGHAGHAMDGGPAPEGIEPAADPAHPVGTEVTLVADHMPGMEGAAATVVGAYETTAYSVDYRPTTGGPEVTDHKWVVQEELEDAGAERLPDGAAVTLAADHMPGMQGAEGTVHSSTDETVYMVDYESDGMRMRNHKWVVESEIASAG